MKYQRGAVGTVMDMSLFLLLLLSGLLCSAFGIWREYHYINESMTWAEAQRYCRENYTDLATADSMNDVNRMINLINDGYSGSVWIGLKRATQSRWGWSKGDDTLAQYSNWDSVNTSSQGRCAFSNNANWFTAPCSTQFYFVCYNESDEFIMSQTVENWTAAQSYCRKHHVDLVTIDSSVIQMWISDAGNVWIGLFLDSWQWSDQWSRFFRNWETGYPSNSSGSSDCVAMSKTASGKWTHDSCDLKHRFICYGRPRPPYRSYHYINQNMSWTEAQSYCRVKYFDLATADSMNDVNRMIKRVNDGYNGSVWIGLKRATQSRWGWSNGENTLSQYSGWGVVPKQPCGYFTDGHWYDYFCSNKYPFVCYNATAGYFQVKSAKTWIDAQSYCRQNNMDLATVKSAEEQIDLHGVVGDRSSVWIGLFLDSWQWSDQWSRFFRNWEAGYPSNSSGSGDCVAMSKTAAGKWTHDSCDLKRPFICYRFPQNLSRHYHYVNEGMTWLDANNYCRARFYQMASVDTVDDVRTMMNEVDPKYSGSVWIGLIRKTQTRWVWSAEKRALYHYINWSPGEPNGAWQCVKSYSGSWFDVDCSLTLPFVCFDDSAGYVFIDTPLTWRDAQSYCRQYHVDLASVSSPEQQRLINDSSSVWIGLVLDSWWWSYQWMLNFRYWATGLSLQGSGNCAAMSTTDSGKWVYHTCEQKLPFFCYGDDKLFKRQIVKLNLSCGGKCYLNDSSLQTTILDKITKKLRSKGLGSSFSVRWGKNTA